MKRAATQEYRHELVPTRHRHDDRAYGTIMSQSCRVGERALVSVGNGHDE